MSDKKVIKLTFDRSVVRANMYVKSLGKRKYFNKVYDILRIKNTNLYAIMTELLEPMAYHLSIEHDDKLVRALVKAGFSPAELDDPGLTSSDVLSPHNIFSDRYGTPKLIDFGFLDIEDSYPKLSLLKSV